MSSDNPSPVLRPFLRRIVIGRNPRFTLIRIAGLVITAAIVLRLFVPIRVVGISMAPNYQNGRFNFVNKIAYKRADPQRGDVVALRFAGESVMLLKRIIALPGERIRIERGVVMINGVPLEEPYLKIRPKRWNRPEEVLEKDEYFVMGDNRSMDIEGHYMGVAERHRILGKAVF